MTASHSRNRQCGDGQRERGRGWVEVGKGGKWETPIIVSTISFKKKKKN